MELMTEQRPEPVDRRAAQSCSSLHPGTAASGRLAGSSPQPGAVTHQAEAEESIAAPPAPAALCRCTQARPRGTRAAAAVALSLQIVG